MNSSKYRVFVCTKKRSPDDPEGCCRNRGSLEVYEAFQSEIKHLQLQERVEVRQSGCLDCCASGAVAMVYQPSRGEFGWLPTKVRVKLRKLLFPQRVVYGNLQPEDIKAIAQSHFVAGKVDRRKCIDS